MTSSTNVSPANADAAPRRGMFMPFALIWGGLIAYGTLLPFKLRPGATPGDQPVFAWLLDVFTSPTWFEPAAKQSSLGISAAASDLAVNLLLLLPLGLLLRLHFRQKGSSLVVQWLVPAFVAAGLCWSIESVQTLLQGRFGAIQDVLTNTGGAVVGIALAPWIARLSRTIVFWVYRQTSYELHRAKELLLALRRSPLVMMLVTALNLLIIGGYFALTSGLGEGTDAHALPFLGLFNRSYDVAAVYAGRAMIVYCLVAGLLSIQFMRFGSRRTISIFILVMALLAFGRQLLEAGGAATVDMTENFIAVMAGGFLLTTFYLLYHAVRCSCRRKTQVPVDVERRRVPFEYRAT